MAQSESHATNRAGPFVAGSTSSELIALASQPDLALRILEQEERIRDYYARCEALRSAASEFFLDYHNCPANCSEFVATHYNKRGYCNK